MRGSKYQSALKIILANTFIAAVVYEMRSSECGKAVEKTKALQTELHLSGKNSTDELERRANKL